MTLTEFLLARIAEDEVVARDLIAEGPWAEFHAGDNAGPSRDDEYSALHVGAGRVLAECEAKRRIVEMYLEHDHSAHAEHKWSGFNGGYATATDHALTNLAAVYADHPDYREEWKP